MMKCSRLDKPSLEVASTTMWLVLLLIQFPIQVYFSSPSLEPLELVFVTLLSRFQPKREYCGIEL